MGYKEDGRYYNWPAPGELIRSEVKRLAKKDGSVVLSGGRIKPYEMYKELTPASFLIASSLGDDSQGVILNFRTIDGKVNPWADAYKRFHENQGRQARGGLRRVRNGHDLWELNIIVGSDVEEITMTFDKAPKEIREGLVVFNVPEFVPAKK